MSEVEYLKLVELREQRDAILKERSEKLQQLRDTLQSVVKKYYDQLKAWHLTAYGATIESNVFEVAITPEGPVFITEIRIKEGQRHWNDRWRFESVEDFSHVSQALYNEFVAAFKGLIKLIEEGLQTFLRDRLIQEQDQAQRDIVLLKNLRL